MKIKTLNCPNCNAKLELENNQTNGICTYCDTPFILDDEVVRIEHEIIDNTSLKVAETTLNKFKDYQKAEILYKNQLHKYAHKEEVYIGLIRSITHDFTQEITQLFRIEEINNYWQKYTSIATKTNISKYSKSVNDLNEKFWLNYIKTETNDFTLFDIKVKVPKLENAWNKYTLFSEEKNVLKIEPKYKDYLSKLKDYQLKANKKRKFTFKLTLSIIVVILLTIGIYTITEKATMKSKEIKTSTLYKYCGPNFDCKDTSYLKEFFRPTIANLTITDYNFNKEKNTIEVKTHLTSKIKDIKETHTFTIKDDSGPYIKETGCKFTDTEDIDLTKCFTLTDYTDGEINVEKATIDKKKNNFKTQGIKTINVTATDKDKNKSKKDIKVEIIPTPITLNFNIAKTNPQINETTTLSYEVTPNVSNKEVYITYNKEYLKIENNTITPLKIGESEVCATSKYDQNTKKCIKVDVTPICQNSYTFNFDGSKKEKITAGTDFCAGTYKVYAGVLNYNQTYFLHHYQADRFAGGSSTMTIAKFSSFLSEEGDKWAMSKGSYIEVPSGITSITITK